MPHRHRQSSSTGHRPPSRTYAPWKPIDFAKANAIAGSFADHIERNVDAIADILLEYESFEVVQDETARTLDLLRSLQENEEYFQLRIGAVASFLPKNQPLYALSCFVIVPSLMASDVHFRIPHAMKHFFPQLVRTLEVKRFFPNVVVSRKQRGAFLRERSALRVDPKTDESLPVTDAVIFTGQPHHAERLRLLFDRRTLFIANGAGHNPVVVAADADVNRAVEAALKLQLYNQGQDCAAPNAILVHKAIYATFLRQLRQQLKEVRVGEYRDRTCTVGPISEPSDLVRIQSLLVDHRRWLDPTTPGIIRTHESMVQPTIICKPLEEGGNFTEVFAPVLFVQRYDEDQELSRYFESPQYARHAMYVTLYGSSPFVDSLIGRSLERRALHEPRSLLHNTHLHAPGMERGTEPYGGNGDGASNLSIQGQTYHKATLPQRDIYEWLAKPLRDSETLRERKSLTRRATRLVHRDVDKILGQRQATAPQQTSTPAQQFYVDAHTLTGDGRRYLSIDAEHTFQLLPSPNVPHIAAMQPDEIKEIRKLRSHLARHRALAVDELASWLYALPKKDKATDRVNRERQLRLFRNVYRLLLGRDSGPRLAHFLLDADPGHVQTLLDV